MSGDASTFEDIGGAFLAGLFSKAVPKIHASLVGTTILLKSTAERISRSISRP
jgi:hypothetical protein